LIWLSEVSCLELEIKNFICHDAEIVLIPAFRSNPLSDLRAGLREGPMIETLQRQEKA